MYTFPSFTPVPSLRKGLRFVTALRAGKSGAYYLLLRLFVLRMSPAPFAVLLKLNFARDKLAVLARPIIDATALRTR